MLQGSISRPLVHVVDGRRQKLTFARNAGYKSYYFQWDV
jgi:hypothetical protein